MWYPAVFLVLNISFNSLACPLFYNIGHCAYCNKILILSDSYSTHLCTRHAHVAKEILYSTYFLIVEHEHLSRISDHTRMIKNTYTQCRHILNVVCIFSIASNNIPFRVMPGFIYSTDQSVMSLLLESEYKSRTVWSIYLTVFYMIWLSKLNEKLLSLPNKIWETYCFCSVSYYYYY